jgi:hypothetical protein
MDCVTLLQILGVSGLQTSIAMFHAFDSLNSRKRLRGMNTLIVLVALAGMFSNTGCRSARDNQIDILERELRTQEDYIYELEGYIVDYSEKLRMYRCADMNTVIASENVGSPELAPPVKSSSPTPAPSPSALRKASPEPTKASAPELKVPAATKETLDASPENLEVPDLEIGEPVGLADPYENATPLIEAGIEGALLADGSFIPDPAAYQTASIAEEGEEAELETEYSEELVEEESQPFEEDITPTHSRDPERLVISHVFRSSDEGDEPTSLLSVVEARDASNEPADFNGKVSLMVMTIIDEKPQRVKRWDFSAEETAAAWQSSNLGDGLHLELPLEQMQLPAGPLELWVRLETADGRKLLAQIPFDGLSLASIESAEEQVAVVDEDIDGATHLTEANPLRQAKPSIKTQPLEQQPVATTSANSPIAADAKSEPQWRAATHYSSGVNSGYATTATAQKWNTRPIGSTAATKPVDQPATKGQQQQWRARRK